MSSLISGYNYDIFISYRQKDNKHDGWVTEFVDNLKGELESTFKEEISVYFDINPHDGLLETHDVDESLKEKLKCLIFIPIISRTYCDPKAFAWEHEFKAFVEHTSKDTYGLKVKLPNGNVANRVLPIVIYDLDKQDIKLFESALGGALRGIEFIYKSAGVNRPLRLKDDLIIESGKVYYRDQVNKVANNIKDVLNSLTARELSVDDTLTEPAIFDEKQSSRKPTKKKTREIHSVSLLSRLKNLDTLSRQTWRFIALILFIGSIGAIWFGIKNTPPLSDKAQFKADIQLIKNLEFLNRNALALSPNGEYLVYVTNGELNLMKLNSDAPSQPISGTTDAVAPFFSPDGTWIGFSNYIERKIMKIPVTGQNPVTICNLEGGQYEDLNQANWHENEIIFAVGSSIYRVSDAGGIPELLYPLNRSENDPVLWNPQLLPDKKTLLFSQQLEDGSWSVMTWRLGSKKDPVVLIERGQDGKYLKSGHIAYTLNNRIYIRKFNSKTKRFVSEPQIIETNPVWELTVPGFGPSQFDFSENGILVYYEQQITHLRNLVWVDTSGAVTPITKDPKDYDYTAISSDAQNIAANVITEEGSYIDIINTKTGNSLMFEEDAICPSWSADNSSVYYTRYSTNNQVFQKPLDLSSPPELLFEMDSVMRVRVRNVSSDKRYLPIYVLRDIERDIGYYDMIKGKVEMLEHYNTDDNDLRAAISPDERWVAYSSNYSGQVAIYVAPFPGPGQPTRVTAGRRANDIYHPEWAPDMTALYYLTTNPDFELWRIHIQVSENDFSFEEAQSFFNGGNKFVRSDDTEIHPNGDRFLVQRIEMTDNEQFLEPRIKVIVNWEQELEGN